MPAPPTGSPRSLTQRPAGSGGRCDACGSNRITELAMTLSDGSRVHFTSCHTCEHRTWESGGKDLALGVVLDRTRKRGGRGGAGR